MQHLLQQYIFRVSETSLVLLPSKLVWWPEQRTLFMADSHFGKASTFRKAGFAVPTGTTTKMLEVLTHQVDSLGAQTLIVLGDLLHSTVHAQRDFESDLEQWRRSTQQLRVLLVKGNHDRRSRHFYEQLAIEIPNEISIQLGPFDLCHAPQDAAGARFSLCGHLHPALQVEQAKLPCFWLRENQLVLPAFGKFTGTARIHLGPTETAIVVCEDSLAAIPAVSKNH